MTIREIKSIVNNIRKVCSVLDTTKQAADKRNPVYIEAELAGEDDSFELRGIRIIYNQGWSQIQASKTGIVLIEYATKEVILKTNSWEDYKNIGNKV